jgi:hypothetical protein
LRRQISRLTTARNKMQNLTLTDFTDIVEKSGLQKVTQITKVKRRRGKGYTPACDFYKKLRERIVKTHRENRPASDLSFLMHDVKDGKKRTNYPQTISAYQSWCASRWGNKKLTWFSPPKSEYERNGIGVSVNPELGLECEGKRYIIKLYLRKEPISRLKTEIINELLGSTLEPQCKHKEVFGVLDVKHAKFYPFDHSDSKAHAKIDAELDYLAPFFTTE